MKKKNLESRLLALEAQVKSLTEQVALLQRNELNQGFQQNVVRKDRGRTSGLNADGVAINFLEQRGVNIHRPSMEIFDDLRQDQETLKALKEHMKQHEKQCTSDSFKSVWKIIQDLER